MRMSTGSQAISPAPPWPKLAAIVGAEHLRPATPADSVDGLVPHRVVEPGTGQEVAEVLRVASEAGLHVIPRGGGSKLGWGNPPRAAELVLSTRRLNRVLEHAWGDLTASVEAGTTVRALEQALAEHGQRLPLDALWPERATVGGILSTNDNGALRTRFGPLRDLIIGVSLALPDGTLAKSGGKVVKNVAGYDLQKLSTGALGTLGVITAAIFRLYPLPRHERTLVVRAASVAVLNKLSLAIQDSWLVVTGLQLRVAPGIQPELDVRIEGAGPASVEPQLRRLEELAGEARPAEAPAEVWQARQALWAEADGAAMVKSSVLPNQLSELATLVERVAGARGLAWKLVAQATGLSLVRLEGAPEALAAAILELRREHESRKDSLAVLGCPAGLKGRFDVWGSPGDALPLMLRIKRQLDPAGTLNPGRFIGGI
jgi:glycolate dehydrogenase FAD-binding subunit